MHSVRNGGAEPRVHLVWDQLLTRQAYETAFGGKADPAWGGCITDDQRTPSAHRVERIGAYLKLPSPVDRDAAEQLDLCDTQ